MIFSDASELGYGVVAYICHVKEPERDWASNALCVRSRIMPNQFMLTIPKKEMAVCLVVAELGQFLDEELCVPKEQMRLFSDSENCLFQLTKNLSVLAPFPANGVAKIQKWGFRF